MIWEPWKRELSSVAESLQRRRTQRRWTPSSFYRLEIELFGAFYAIRKLIEGRKLSDDVVGRTVSVETYPSRGKPIHLMNWDKVDELYDLDARPCIEERWLHHGSELAGPLRIGWRYPARSGRQGSRRLHRCA